MKLRIENSDAREAQFGVPHGTPRRDGGRVWVDLEVEPQRSSHWCWAAIGVALAAYYHDRRLDQESVAGASNVDRPLDKVLEEHGCFGHWSMGKPSFERIRFEIDAGRPVCIRIQWYAGGAHYVVIRGCDSTLRTLLIEDSLSGPSEHVYSRFPDDYAKRGGVWTETFWTEKAVSCPRRAP